ncbi:MAG: AI-2E family transporter [Prevotellaceae bacterium]|jgi:predicted PurR-regulated permease PerM|nr:AI-2E family transporter [Prevotellaceae bacterium]
MNKLARYIIIAVVAAFIAFAAWFFSNILAYVIISVVLSILGKPLVRALGRVRIGQYRFPRTLAAAIALLGMWGVLIACFYFLLPAVVNLLNHLSNININQALSDVGQWLDTAQEWLVRHVPGIDASFSLRDTLAGELTSLFSKTAVLTMFGSVTNTLIGFIVGAFVVSFITFFFLREEDLFMQGVLLLFPARHEANATAALTAVNRLLSRYFIGLAIDMCCMMTLVTNGLVLVAGLPFEVAIVLGALAGILNVIPYIGAIVSALTGIVIGLLMSLEGAVPSDVVPMIVKMASVYIGAQALDAAVLQPFIYSKSVRTHPLEIFLVILIAGSIGGIVGMLVAIPAYTVLRVFAKQFFNQFKLVQRLTKTI